MCGGKLQNHRCVECGLDNTQNDDRYKDRINRSVCDGEQLTHVHEEREPKAPVYQQKKPKVEVSRHSKMNTAGRGNKKKRGKGKFSLVAAVLTLILTVGPVFGDFVDEIKDSFMEDMGMDGGTPEIYAYVTRELSEEGENYETVLEPGIYEVGVHIPEGTYRAVMEEGSNGYINLRDEENSIYHFISLGDYEGAVNKKEDIRMYDGAVLEVSMGVEVQMYSENAQTDAMHGMDNPLTEEVTIRENVQAGVDFEPGVYDIFYISSENEDGMYGSITYTTPIFGEESEAYSYDVYFDGNLGMSTYRNVVLPKGTTITMEGLKAVKLTPSPLISDMDYEQFYSRY